MSNAEHMPCGCPSPRRSVRDAGVFGVRRSTYVPGCAMGVHAHGEDRIVLTVRGGLESIYGAKRMPLDEFRAVYRPAGIDHRDRYPSETVCIAILLPTPPRSRAAFAFYDEDLPAVAHRLNLELDASDSAADLAVETLCAEVAARLGSERRERTPAPWLRRIRDRIEDEYAQPPALETIAAAVNRNASHVAAAFRAAYGKTIGDYVRDVRVWRTRALVEDASIPLADVAQRGGFADQSHFARVFKRRFAMTPGAYRRRANHGRNVRF